MTKKTTKKPTTQSNPFGATIELKDGKRKLKLNSPDFFHAQLEMFPLNTKITLWLDSKPPTRSQQQNAFYWMYLGIIAGETGEDKDSLHSFFKGKFLSQGITEVFGYKVRKIKSTTKLSKSEFCEFLLRIEELTDIKLPNTEDYNPSHYENTMNNYPKNDGAEPKF